jgi:hypothetical protein
MPTNRTYRGRLAGQATLSEAAQRYLRGETDCDGLSLFGWNELCHLLAHGGTAYHLTGDAARQVSGLSARELVEQHGDPFLAEYIAEHPGQRPHWWWHFNTLDNGELLLRQRIGGVGVTHGDDHFSYGMPTGWVTPMDQIEERTWPGKPLHQGPAVDPANPPIFESSATFLERHGLLVTSERKRLKPEDFEPEVIELADYELVDDDVGGE